MELTAAQRKLVETAIPVVHTIAARTHRRFPEVPFQDFVSLGNEAAVDAARTYNPAFGVPFELFAVKRISGAMVREGCAEHFGSLHILVKNALTADIEPPPADLTLDEALDDTPEKARARAVAWIRRETAGIFIGALTMLEKTSPSVEDAVAERQAYDRTQEVLNAAIAGLPKDERHLIQRHYREGATFDAIAAELGVVKRTVVRMHDRIKTTLGDKLRTAGITRAPELVDDG